MRADVDYVVTEFGVAKLKGRTLRERAFALLDIADPKFRDEIVAELKALKGANWLARHEPALRKA
jgi:4-hydroxybutyrate CoA-transferase